MAPPTLEHQFERFRLCGDPAALASVFDETSTEILKVAAHLSRNRATAEDLLQRTFLSAIEAAPTWDPSRRLMPWLRGILANHAKEVSRRAARSLDPDRLATREAEDPVEAASRHEDADAVGLAIDELADPAKSILVLRYRHGLEPADIAAQLGMPPATVRSHLHRGIESVRKRVSVAGAAIFGLDDTETCLVEIRRVVVARAAEARAEIAAAAGAGPRGPRRVRGRDARRGRTLAWVSILLLALGGAALLLPRPEPESGRESARQGSSDDRATAALDTRPREATLAAGGRATARAAISDRDSAALGGDPTKGSLEILAVATNGDVMPDEMFSFTPGDAPDPLRHRTGRTDAEGNGRLAGLEPGRGWVYLAHGWGDTVEIKAGELTKAEIRLSGPQKAFFNFDGIVVDGQGAPVGDAEVWIDCLVTRWNTMMPVARTKADGTFSVHDAHARLTVSARKAGYASSSCRYFTGEARPATVRLVLVGPGISIRGRVEDADQRPVAKALVLIGSLTGPASIVEDGAQVTEPLPFLTFTASDGTFAADGLPRGETSILVRPRDRGAYREIREVSEDTAGDAWVIPCLPRWSETGPAS